MAIELVFDTSTQDGWEVLSVSGEIDAYTSPRLRERLTELLDSGRHHVIVNLQGVEFMDSTGLGVLVGGGHVLRPARVAEVRVLRPDAWVIEPGRDGVRVCDLPVLVGEQRGARAVQNTRPAGAE